MKFKLNLKNFRPVNFKPVAKAVKETAENAVSGAVHRLDKFDDFIGLKGLKGFNKADFAKRLQEDIQGDGTGSFIVDGLAGLAGKVFGKEKVQKAIYKVQKPFHQADVAAGKFVAKGPLKGLFTTRETRKVGEAITQSGAKLDLSAEVDIPRLTAPFDKVKKLVMPYFASAYVFNKWSKNKKNQQENENAAERLQLEQENEARLQEYKEKTARLAQQAFAAGEALEKSASEIERLTAELQLAKAANEQMRLFIIADKRSERSTKLAYGMLDAMMIKQADLDSQIEKIMEMDDAQFDKLQEEVKAERVKKAQQEESGISKLSEYLCFDNYGDDVPVKANPNDKEYLKQRVHESARRVLKNLPHSS